MTADYLKKQLSARELEVLRLSSQGLTDKEIAQNLSVSLGTVHTYWTRIRSKCFGKTRAEIVSKHVRHQIMTEEIGNEKSIYAESVLNAIPVIVMLFDTKFILRFANQRLSNISSAPGSGVGRSLDELGLDPDCTKALRRGMTNVLGGGTGVSVVDANGFRCDFMRYPLSPGNVGVLVIKVPPQAGGAMPVDPLRRYAMT